MKTNHMLLKKINSSYLEKLMNNYEIFNEQ